MSRRRAGFTFVELLVAFVVFGALSAIAVPRYHQVKEKAFKSAMKADLAELRIAQEAYWAENQSYTTDSTQLDWRSTSNVRVHISSGDLVAGYDATAEHLSLPGIECTTAVGRVTALGVPSGDIRCGPTSGVGAGSGTSAPLPAP